MSYYYFKTWWRAPIESGGEWFPQREHGPAWMSATEARMHTGRMQRDAEQVFSGREWGAIVINRWRWTGFQWVREI